ncbi:uncharacterized protein PITG_04750 [Phytophthora infestans T30-4]|uniref:Uncharacterized protein n=1 Tax=Phytophthora infestans (strain T30-4) TaxID=403677 RepID=D0N1Y8_PHYIT|nr:uncharacterized protein PITG_04750 [Phytophthora infestans T30-4]EEY68317.1 conserved hypothetical protein [Phytophthora infestans T30-4]|eukprot:XP_002905476.1 conserved hypothetical protein [Phytophthora infestans T30-4]
MLTRGSISCPVKGKGSIEVLDWNIPTRLNSNHMPNYTDEAGEIARRLMIVKFGKQVPDDEVDVELEQKVLLIERKYHPMAEMGHTRIRVEIESSKNLDRNIGLHKSIFQARKWTLLRDSGTVGRAYTLHELQLNLGARVDARHRNASPDGDPSAG